MIWREMVRILRCGPSKRPAADPTYIRTSHPSMGNLNETASANSLNKSNYATKLLTNNNINGNQNEPQIINQNIEMYNNDSAVYSPDLNSQYYRQGSAV